MRSKCPIATSLGIIGDRWSLVLVRDLMFSSKRRYNELLDSPEGITTNILADRLRKLEAAGVVKREPYQKRPLRYEYALTDKGLDLFEIIAALIRWGGKHDEHSVQFSEAKLAQMDPRR